MTLHFPAFLYIDVNIDKLTIRNNRSLQILITTTKLWYAVTEKKIHFISLEGK